MIPRQPGELYINLWRARDGSVEAQAFTDYSDALEEIGAEYPAMSYAGTVTVPPAGSAAIVEDLSQAAHHYAVDATDEWLEQHALRQRHHSRVL